jgi:hypothetical protein
MPYLLLPNPTPTICEASIDTLTTQSQLSKRGCGFQLMVQINWQDICWCIAEHAAQKFTH